MPPQMLQSQFDSLEPPHPDEAITLNVDDTVEALVAKIVERLPVP